MSITPIEDIEKNILKEFSLECNEDLLKEMIDNFKKESILRNCAIFADWYRSSYKDNLSKTININIKYLKQKNEKNLVFARCFYSLCKDKDILDKIYDILSSPSITTGG